MRLSRPPYAPARLPVGVDTTLPVLTEMDVRAIKEFSQDFEIDFISLRWGAWNSSI